MSGGCLVLVCLTASVLTIQDSGLQVEDKIANQ